MKGKKTIMLLLIATLLMGSIPISVNALDVPVEIEDVENEDGDAITTGVYGDVVVVKGIGVSSGYQVSVYWDSLKEWNGEEGLLNTTDADPAGTFEIWFEVPNATAGDHYIWVEDLNLEDNDVWDTPFVVEPSVELSSDSGLNEDDIMVKGFGFDGEEDVALFLVRNALNPVRRAVNETTDEFGDGAETEFEFTIEETTIWPGTVRIHSEFVNYTEEIRDTDGDGILQSYNITGGPALNDDVGSIDYLTGDVELEFEMAVGNGDEIVVSYDWLDDFQNQAYGFSDAVDTNAVGFFYEEVEMPETGEMAPRRYQVLAVDANGNTANKTFTIGPVITLDYKEGPTGLIVTMEGRGFRPRGMGGDLGYIPEDGVWMQDEDGDEGNLTCTILDLDDNPDGAGAAVEGIENDNDGEFELEFVVPWTWMDGDHKVNVIDAFNNTASADFEVTALPELTLSVGYGISGSKIDITGENFVQLSGKEVDFEVWENEFDPKDLSDAGDKVEDIGTTLKTTKDGTFSGTITMPALDDARYQIVARQPNYGIHANETFRVTLLVVVLSTEEGVSGESITMTGSGFTPDGEVNASIDGEELFTEDASVSGSFSEAFYVPSLEAGEYTIEVWDVEEEILVTLDFEVTMTTYLVLDPEQAPAEYNLTIEGYYFSADDDGGNNDLEFVLYNRTEDGESDEEWNLDVRQTEDPGVPVELNEDGNFTAWFVLPDEDELSTGVYYINCTDEEDLFAQIMFNVVDETEEVTPRKDVFQIGDVVSFNIRVSFAQDDSYITILSPDGEVYWETEPFDEGDDDWIDSGVFEVVPAYRQLADGEPMLLDPAAPLGEWEWTWYEFDDDEIQSGTFMVEEEPIPQPILDEINDLNEAVTGLDEQISGVSDEVSGLQSTVNDAITAANAAEDAANDAKNAINTVTQTANDALTAAQNAEDAANKAEEAVNSITNLVWGSIVAALIAALAAIVSLLQISRRIAG